MIRDLKDILTEVLIFPYEDSVVDALADACLKYAETIKIGSFEDCVLHLCMDIPATDLIEHINAQIGRKFPNRAYRALAGYVVGEALDNSDEGDNVVFPLALRNAMKAKTNDADGIISKTIDSACFASVEDYWKENASIPSLEGEDLVSNIFEYDTWADTGLDIESTFGNIKSLAKFYNREQFKKAIAERKPTDNIYAFANQVADEIVSQYWLFTAENPVKTLKNLELKGTTKSLSKIKSEIRGNDDTVNDEIDNVSVFRRFLYANDYVDISSNRISPLNFAIAIFYELLYERLKSEKYE